MQKDNESNHTVTSPQIQPSAHTDGEKSLANAENSLEKDEDQNDLIWKELFPRKIMAILMPTLVIVLVLPVVLTRSACWSATSFTNSGQIGDTIGGTTAPVIGLLSIVMLYITIRLQWMGLKEEQRQRKLDSIENERRHKEVQDQIDIKYLIEQIDKLDSEVSKIGGTVGGIKTYPVSKDDPRIASLTIWMLEVQFVMNWINRLSIDTFMIRRKLGVNYRIKYQSHIEDLERHLNTIVSNSDTPDITIIDFLVQVKEIKILSDAKKY